MRKIYDLLMEFGFFRMKKIRTSWPLFSIDKYSTNNNLYRVYSPSVDKVNGSVALSGLVGIIDTSGGLSSFDDIVSIDAVGRHMLSLTAEWNLNWRDGVECISFEHKIIEIRSFLEKLPKTRDGIRNVYANGDLEKMKMILNESIIKKYLEI